MSVSAPCCKVHGGLCSGFRVVLLTNFCLHLRLRTPADPGILCEVLGVGALQRKKSAANSKPRGSTEIRPYGPGPCCAWRRMRVARPMHAEGGRAMHSKRSWRHRRGRQPPTLRASLSGLPLIPLPPRTPPPASPPSAGSPGLRSARRVTPPSTKGRAVLARTSSWNTHTDYPESSWHGSHAC
jgi:hypothetical protein